MEIKCTKCLEVKDETMFSKNKRYRTGYLSWCKKCHRDYYRQPEQKAKLAILTKTWAERNPERRKQIGKEWFERNKERHHETTNKRGRERWATDPEYRNRKNFQKKPHNRSRDKIESKGDLTIEKWNEICYAFGNICLCCGAPDITVDHIVPLSRGGLHNEDNVQPLCASCNSSKGILAIDYRWRWKTISTCKFTYAVGE